MQVIQVSLSYTGALDMNPFESAKAYLKVSLTIRS